MTYDLNVNEAISAGSTQIPYQELTFTIPALQRLDVFQVFNYFRVMTISGGTLKVKFGQNGLESPFTAAGIGLRAERTFDRLTLINSHATDSMTITIAMALGYINDDRLNVSGTVTVSGTVQIDQSNTFATSQPSVGTTAVQLVTAGATNASITIEAGVADLYIGLTSGVTTGTGFLIPAGGAYTFNPGFTGDVYGIRGVAAQTAYVLREGY